MNITLLTSKDFLASMIKNASLAAKCSRGIAEPDRDPIEHLLRIQKLGHENIFEHITLSFFIKDLSRACLIELERHRHLSMTVESTRYTLKKKFAEEKVTFYKPDTLFEHMHEMLLYAVSLMDLAVEKYPLIPNDVLKYLMPECICTNLVLTANVRALREMIKKRTVPQALPEFRNLCYAIYDAMPVDYSFLFDDCIFDPEQESGIKK